MSDVVQTLVQQVIVPAYVWEDDEQRQAVLTAAATSLARAATAQELALDGDLYDAAVTPAYLKAVVGVVGDVRFVAYEPCPREHADLVFVAVSKQTVGEAS